MRTYSKAGEIYLKPCYYKPGDRIFPLNKHPLSWDRCNDAYMFTWLKDSHQELASLTALDHMKLAYSTGYCPQNRCQLSNSSDALVPQGGCPIGLCYTKLEYGSLSFGACCYTEGAFLSGNLIGFYNKSVIVPKPIYAHSRVILKTDNITPDFICYQNETSSCQENQSNQFMNHDSKLTSYDSFINANYIYPNIIASQCPISTGCITNTNESIETNCQHSPGTQVDTTQDVLHMIHDEKVSLWIQLSPDFHSSSLIPTETFRTFYTTNILHKKCGMLPLEYLYSNLIQSPTRQPLQYSMKDLQMHNFDPDTQYGQYLSTPSYPGYVNITYKVQDSFTHFNANSQTVKHIWYYNWKDYELPTQTDAEVRLIRTLVSEAVDTLKRGKKVLITCKSGRFVNMFNAYLSIGL